MRGRPALPPTCDLMLLSATSMPASAAAAPLLLPPPPPPLPPPPPPLPVTTFRASFNAGGVVTDEAREPARRPLATSSAAHL